MKKSLTSILLLPVVLLTACNNNSSTNEVSNTITESIPSCSSKGAETVLVCTTNTTSVLPFNSGIYLNLYGEDHDNQSIKDAFINDMAFYSALFDRHYEYRYRKTTQEEYKDLFNLRNFNNYITELKDSHEETSSIVLEKELYDGIKAAINFSINSEINNSLKYNLTVGRLSSLYDQYITQAQTFGYQGYINELAQTDELIMKIAQMRDNNKVVVNIDFKEDEFNKAKSSILSKDQLTSMFSFNDSKQEITINNILEYDETTSPQITLGGYGKGYAQKIFADKFKDTALLLNGGSSSIMTQNVKTNGRNWSIRIENPLYREEASYNGCMTGLAIPFSEINEAEFYFESETSFILSTSGYYNNFFYTMDEDENKILRHHIIDGSTGNSPTFFDSASIMISDPGYADMYSTALLNCSSLEEAEQLREKLDQTYNFDTFAFYTYHDKLNFVKDKVIAYVPEAHKDMFHLMTKNDVSNLYPLVTEIQTFN